MTLCLVSTISSCGEGSVFPSSGGPAGQGWVPIYVDSNGLNTIINGEFSTYQSKLYELLNYNYTDSSNFQVIGPYRYVMDSLRGIVIQDAQQEIYSSSRLAYLQVPGINTIDIEVDQLVVNNLNDEVVLSVANAPELTVLTRRSGTASLFMYPDEKPEIIQNYFNPDATRYFECFDSSKGVLIGWSLELSGNFECFLLPE